MKFFNIFKRKKVNERLSEEQLLDALWKKWTKNEISSPLSELMTFISNLGAMGHADFFEACENSALLQRASEVALPLIPENIKNNYLLAQKIYNATQRTERYEDFLDAYDDYFYDNDYLLDKLLLTYINNEKT